MTAKSQFPEVFSLDICSQSIRGFLSHLTQHVFCSLIKILRILDPRISPYSEEIPPTSRSLTIFENRRVYSENEKSSTLIFQLHRQPPLQEENFLRGAHLSLECGLTVEFLPTEVPILVKSLDKATSFSKTISLRPVGKILPHGQPKS